MIEPLKIWKSEEVKDLLIDFFSANFVASKIDINLAKEIIEKAWKARDSLNIDLERKEVSNLFEQAKLVADYQLSETNPIDLFNLDSTRTFLDIGANKFDMLNYLAHNQPTLEKLIAIDVVPQNANFRYPEKSFYYQINSDLDQFPIEESSIDLINIQFVFHHFQDDSSIQKMLQHCKRVLKPNGKVILWEESFVDEVDSFKLVEENRKLNILTDEKLTKRFYDLDLEKRWEFIIANDWIINVKNDHMQWTGMYKKWEEWVGIFEQNGFKLQKDFNLGLRINGRLKQGVHMIGEFILVNLL